MLRRLAFVRAARNIGLSLDEVAAALATLPDGRTPTKADWARLSRAWRSRLDEQIDGLVALRDGLDSCIGCGCLSLRRCAFSNPADLAARAGPGAAFLPRSLRRAGGRTSRPPSVTLRDRHSPCWASARPVHLGTFDTCAPRTRSSYADWPSRCRSWTTSTSSRWTTACC